MTPIIQAQGVSKSYRLGPHGGYRTLREILSGLVHAPFRRQDSETFWALDDVSFTVAPGEAVGIIGRNGAGKSTLLKILSRITAPTRGEVRLRGRIAALLEVGTGFHPELSGRENIYLNGAIMGMPRSEIKRRFDEIVAFAEVDKFLETPVKRYSSGMYVRLAFAVAAHLQPDILIVDEVLAVGDASFQKKCLGKMQTAASGGRTVLFVSHNMAAVSRLCTRCILLQHGRIVADGPVAKVIGAYSAGVSGESPSEIDFEKRPKPPGNEHVRLLAARLVTQEPGSTSLDIRRPLEIQMDFEVLEERYAMNPNVHFFNEEGTCVFISSDAHVAEFRRPRGRGRYRATLTIPGNFLAEGLFSLDLAISTVDPLIVHLHERGAFTFQVHDPGEGDSARGVFGGPMAGVVRPLFPWKTERIDETMRDRQAGNS